MPGSHLSGLVWAFMLPLSELVPRHQRANYIFFPLFVGLTEPLGSTGGISEFCLVFPIVTIRNVRVTNLIALSLYLSSLLHPFITLNNIPCMWSHPYWQNKIPLDPLLGVLQLPWRGACVTFRIVAVSTTVLCSILSKFHTEENMTAQVKYNSVSKAVSWIQPGFQAQVLVYSSPRDITEGHIAEELPSRGHERVFRRISCYLLHHCPSFVGMCFLEPNFKEELKALDDPQDHCVAIRSFNI